MSASRELKLERGILWCFLHFSSWLASAMMASIMRDASHTQRVENPCLGGWCDGLFCTSCSVGVSFLCCRRDAVDALSLEIRSLLTGPLKGKRTGVGELRKKMEAQSDVQVRARQLESLSGAPP